MKENIGKKLIEELLSNPDMFLKYGKSYTLLQEYFGGLDVDTLIPILESNDERIQKPAIWIISELAGQARSLLQHVMPLVDSSDKYIRYYALEFIFLCATAKDEMEIIHLVNAIDDKEPIIRILIMKLLSNAIKSQLQSAIKFAVELKVENYQIHQYGLNMLLNMESTDEETIVNMLNKKDAPLTQQYGVMLAKKKYELYPHIMESAVSSNNSDVREFAQMVINMNQS
jgi:hypothetical protein